MKNDISYFAQVKYRNDRRKFGITQSDRHYHMYIVGKSGTGKTTLLETLLAQDIDAQRSIVFLDPHGDSVERLVQYMPQERHKDLIYLDLTDPSQPYRYNPLQRVGPELRPLVTAGMLSVFERLFTNSWGDRLSHILRYTILALLEQANPSLRDILPMIQDKAFRNRSLKNVTSKEVLEFWNREFKRYQDFHLVPIYNKLGQFLAYPVVRRVLFENTHDLKLRSIMDEGKILLVNLSKGVIGEDASQLLGSLLVTSLGLASFSRANILEKTRRPCHIFLDEFQNFTGSNLPHMLSELRKYRVSLTLAHQYTAQLQIPILDAVLGNVGTLISFRIGGKDAPYIAREMPVFSSDDLIHLPNHHIYLKLMINGTPSKPFSATTLRLSDIPRTV